MNNKTLAIISYVTIIGWVISYLTFKDQSQKSSLVSYHLKQGLGIFIISLLLSATSYITGTILGTGIIGTIGSILSLILLVIGILNANKEKEIPVPVVGKIFEDKFSFLN